jgi:signal transduction histidine kinase
MTAVLAVAGLAVGFGLVQAGRAYLRAVELARRQSEFMAAVSHEMRTPLAAMRLLAENLESGVADRAGQREQHTKLIREECARLGDLVDNVLAFTRGGNGEPLEFFDVAAMVADVASLVEPMAARRNIEFECAVAGFPEPPSGDVAALRRALLNLLDNALKHTPDSGKVTCRAFSTDNDSWKLEVSDTGPGIPAAERKRIFEAFYRIGDELRRTTPGTGLGLALVKRTAEAHGGKITVNDASGGGACFTLSLPIKP